MAFGVIGDRFSALLQVGPYPVLVEITITLRDWNLRVSHDGAASLWPSRPCETAWVPADDRAEGRLEQRPGGRVVTLVTRSGCHLCEVAEGALAGLASELGFALELVDVDSSRRLANEYSDRVPVILIDGAEHGYWQLEEQRFRTALAQPPKAAPNP
jgi:glutaredoxin